MTEALIYARFSKADQVKGHTIDRQLDNAREVCAARGLSTTDDRIFIEAGKSAFTGANRRKGSLLRNIEDEIEAGVHRGRTLVVEHLDRISRQGWREVYGFLEVCNEGGVTVATWDGGRHYPAGKEPNMGEVIEIIVKSNTAREESEKKSFRVRKSFAEKREAAEQGVSKRIASRPPSWIRRLPNGQGYELIEEHAEIVREAHRLCQLGYGTAQIAKIFNERNYPTWRATSNGWHESYVGRMLTMRTAIGEYVSTVHGTRILDYYPPCITVDCFDRTQAARAKRTTPASRGRRGTAQTNLFQMIARCSHCGGPMSMKPSRTAGKEEKRAYPSGNTSSTKVNTSSSYLRCVNSQRRVTDTEGKRVCLNRKHIRYERLEPAVLDQIMALAMDNDRYNFSDVSQSRIALAEVERNLTHHQETRENLKENLKLKVSATLMDMLSEVEDKIAESIVQRDALLTELNRSRGSQPSTNFLSRIAATREAMAHPDHDTRREARTMVHDSLKAVISDLLCDEAGNVMVIVANGLAAFRVNSAGRVDWRHDSSNDPTAIRSLTTHAFADNASTVEAVMDRAKRIQSATFVGIIAANVARSAG